MSVEFKIEGMDEVVREIKNISEDRVKRLELLKILRRQMKPVLNAVKDNTPEYDGDDFERKTSYKGATVSYTHKGGTLKRSMKMFTKKSKEIAGVEVGPKVGKRPKDYDDWLRQAGKFGDNGYYAWFIVKGTSKTGWGRGIKPNDFIWKAFAPIKTGTEKKMTDQLGKYLQRKFNISFNK